MLRTGLLALVFLASLSACGGGGDATGTCVFGPEACSRGSGGSGPGGGDSSYLQQGEGAAAFVLPAGISAIRIDGSYDGVAKNFAVYVGQQLAVNVVIGTQAASATHTGVYIASPGAEVRVEGAGVKWQISAATATSPPAGPLSRTGVGDAVFDLPMRPASYRIQASFSGTSENFAVLVNGSLLVNEIIGSSHSPATFSGTFALPASARVQIVDAPLVQWSFVEVTQ